MGVIVYSGDGDVRRQSLLRRMMGAGVCAYSAESAQVAGELDAVDDAMMD